MRSLTARRMMRTAPATAPAELPIAAFKLQFPLGSTSRVLLEDAAGHYAGLVPTAEVFTDTGIGARPISELAILQDVTLSPDQPIGEIMERFDDSEADDLAIVDEQGCILGMLTEKYVRKRYADEIDQSQRALYGED